MIDRLLSKNFIAFYLKCLYNSELDGNRIYSKKSRIFRGARMNTTQLFVGNIVIFIGALFMVAIGLIKSKKNILIAQNFQFLIMGIGNLILGGTSGFISNIVSIARNLFCLKFELTTAWKVFFMALQVIVSGFFMYFTGFSAWELLPIMAAILFTWILDTDKASVIKIVIIVAQFMWIGYDFHIHSVTGLFFDSMTILSNLIGMVRARRTEAVAE